MKTRLIVIFIVALMCGTIAYFGITEDAKAKETNLEKFEKCEKLEERIWALENPYEHNIGDTLFSWSQNVIVMERGVFEESEYSIWNEHSKTYFVKEYNCYLTKSNETRWIGEGKLFDIPCSDRSYIYFDKIIITNGK